MRDASSRSRQNPSARGGGARPKPKLRARRSLSQNFLIDIAVAGRIAAALPIRPDDMIYEIGAGKGFLTEYLVGQVRGADHLWAVEKDHRMVGMLRKKFPGGGAVRVVHADVLDLPPDAEPPERCWLIGNLPFGIGHAILNWAFDRRSRFLGALVTLQREVVHRLLAGPGESGRSAASLWFQARARGQALFNIPPRAFHPPPRVTSTVMWIEFAPTTPGIETIPGIEYVIHSAFAQKRKVLANNLRAIPHLSAQQMERVRAECGDLLRLRAEELTALDFARLARALKLDPTTSPLGAGRP
ncbi:MAG: ribosomal RNA small subunit methyltransferase A [candidate division Zixibacteria bacterium]|nr:ribosomal RNA small subunit methyltransferase A [candidate division Zixibacteria bacterium]